MSSAAPPAFRLPAALASAGFALRRAHEDDLPFQRALFETARPDAPLLAAWPEQARRTFLDQQFHFQTVHYERAFPQAERLIVFAGGAPVGRLILDRSRTQWCVVDIALLPAWRGRGVGTALLQEVQAAAARQRAPCLYLTVAATGHARRLYERLGFVTEEEMIPDVAMIWRPPAAQLKTA